MSICYSSEADLCLLCSQLCLLTIFCLPEKNEHWGQSEKWGEGRQRRPNLKLQGRHNWITQVKQEVCSWDQPEAHSLSEGSGCDSAPAHWHLQGWASGREPLPGVSPPGVSPLGWVSGREPPPGFSPWLLRGPARLPRLCCDLPALPPGGPFPALRCSPPTLSLSWILSAATGQAGDSGITRPSLQPVSCPRSALLLESWVDGVPGVHYWEFPSSQLPPFLMVGCAGQLKTFLNFLECGCYMNLVCL